MEQNDEWTEARRYMGLEILTKVDTATKPPTDTTEEVPALEALSA